MGPRNRVGIGLSYRPTWLGSGLYPPPSVATSHYILSGPHFASLLKRDLWEKNVKSKMLINFLHSPGILQPLRGSHHPPDWPRPQGALPDDRLTQEVRQIILKTCLQIKINFLFYAIIRVVDPHWFNADPDPDPVPDPYEDPDPDPVPNPGFGWPKIEKNL